VPAPFLVPIRAGAHDDGRDGRRAPRIIDTRPMRHGLVVMVSRMICGSQKVTP
jgi:hypothetical protein